MYGIEKPIPLTTQNAEAIAKYEMDLKEWNRSPKVKKARSIIGATVSINGGEKPKTALSAVLQNAENRQCFYCGQVGHIKRNCPVRKYRKSRNLDELSDGDSDEPMTAKLAF